MDLIHTSCLPDHALLKTFLPLSTSHGPALLALTETLHDLLDLVVFLFVFIFPVLPYIFAVLSFFLSIYALHPSSKPHLGLPREQFSSPLLGLVEKTGVLLLLQQQHHIEVRLDNNNNINKLYFEHNSTTRSFNSYRNDY